MQELTWGFGRRTRFQRASPQDMGQGRGRKALAHSALPPPSISKPPAPLVFPSLPLLLHDMAAAEAHMHLPGPSNVIPAWEKT